MDLFKFRGDQISRVPTLFDPFVGARLLFGLSLRPRPGGVRERLLLVAQRLIAARLRRRPLRDAT